MELAMSFPSQALADALSSLRVRNKSELSPQDNPSAARDKANVPENTLTGLNIGHK